MTINAEKHLIEASKELKVRPVAIDPEEDYRVYKIGRESVACRIGDEVDVILRLLSTVVVENTTRADTSSRFDPEVPF